VSGRPTIALGIVSHNRPGEVVSAVASADGEDVAEIVVVDSASQPPIVALSGTQHVRSDDNIACGGGRNCVIEHIASDIVLFLDDDAVLMPGTVERVRAAFDADPEVGAVATHLVRPGGEEERIEQPFRAGHPLPVDDVDCGYFIGAGFAVRAEVYRAVGGSDARMRYGGDDIELAMRVQQAGHRIRWLHDARVEHRPSTAGRMTSGVKAGSHGRARIWLARAYLPWPIALLHAGIWILLTGREALGARDMRPWVRYVREGLTWPVQRRRMTFAQLRRLHAIGGRVFY
jgi:GT2 family glycosyltransferase